MIVYPISCLGSKPAASVQVAFGPGVTPSSSIRRHCLAKDDNDGKSSSSGPKSSDYGQTLLSSPSAANQDEGNTCSADRTSKSAQIVQKEYREPWVKYFCPASLFLSLLY